MPAVVIDLAAPHSAGARGGPQPTSLGPRTRAVALLALGVWTLAWFWLLSRHGGLSWHYFVDSGHLIQNVSDPSGGLHLYATRPDLQFGPVSVVGAAVLLLLGNTPALVMAQVATTVAGLLILLAVRTLVHDAYPGVRQRVLDTRVFLAAIPFVPVWMNLAVRFVHIDDMLALLLTTYALVALRRQHPYVAAVLLALGVDAKPWAIPFVALLLLVQPGRRLRCVGIWLAVVGAAWIPFVLADPRTVLVGRFQIPVDPTSVLALFGLGDSGTPPWTRVTQVVIGTVLAAVAVRRGRWAGVVLLVVLSRIVIDPGAHSYYAAGVVVGAALWDVVGTTRRLPWWTLTSAVAFFAFRWVPQPDWAHAVLTLGFFLAAAWCIALRPSLVPSPAGRWIVMPARVPSPAVCPVHEDVGAGAEPLRSRAG